MATTHAAPKRGTKKLSEVARRVVKPADIATTGWGPVRDTCREKLGVTFDRWQDGAGRLILAEREDGKLAAAVGGVGMSLPRQVGKTYLLAGLIFGLCINRPGLLVIWSAHHARTHGETFLAMQAFATRSKVAPYIEQVFVGSGDEEIRFANGSRVLFGARERGFGRGIPGVDALVMDEAQILSDKALENMLATLNTSLFGLQLYIGTPPKPEDNSETFTRMRNDALDAPHGVSEDAVWIECGADPDCDPDDRKQWAKANPSYPHRTSTEAILRLRKRLKLDGFRREALGIWPDLTTASLFPSWPTLKSDGDPPKPAALGIAADLDQTRLSLGAASSGEVPHLGSVLKCRATEAARFVAEVRRIQTEHKLPVAIDSKGPASFLIPALEAAGVKLTKASLDDYVQSCADLTRAVEAGEVSHGDYDDLNKAVAAAGWRKVGDRRAFARKSGDISSLEAVTLALWGTTVKQSAPQPFAMWG